MTENTQNIKQKPNVYFCIEYRNSQYKGVKVKDVATISNDLKKLCQF